MIGNRSQLVGEQDQRIYLTDRKSLPYWKQILGQPVILRIDVSGLDEKNMEFFEYSQYSEWMYSKSVDPKWITRSNVHTCLANDQHRDLCLSFIDTISQISIMFARYITFYHDKDDIKKALALDCLDYCKDICKTMRYILPNLDFGLVSAKDLRTHLKLVGDGGCTLCDTYEPGFSKMDYPIRLWQLLGQHELKTDETVWLYDWLKKTFPRRLRVDTGGWTG